MLKVIIDILSGYQDTILNNSILFFITFLIGAFVSIPIMDFIYKNRIEELKERLVSRDEKIKNMEQELASKAEDEQNLNRIFTHLSQERIIAALTKIEEFESKNPEQTVEYSVKALTEDLNIHDSEADEMLKELRRLGFFASIWDSIAQFPARNRPINEARPGRLTLAGRHFLERSR